MSEEIKRMRYFNGLILREEEFDLEQNYNVSMRRMHNRLFHGAGLVDGLELGLTNYDYTITVKKGIAIDPQGNEIVLANDVIVDVSEYGLNTYFYLWIKYHEEPVDIIPARGGDSEIHTLETGIIEHGVVPPVTKDFVLIGRIFRFEADSGAPAIYGDSLLINDENGNPVRVLAGEEKKTLTTAWLNISDPLIPRSEWPYIKGKMFPDSTPGIDFVSPLTQFTGDVNITQNLKLSGGTGVGEIKEDLVTVTGTEGASLATASAIQNHLSYYFDPLNEDLSSLKASRSTLPENDTIAMRDGAGKLQAESGVVPLDVVNVGQLQERGYLSDLSAVSLITDLNLAEQTGFYTCNSDALNNPTLEETFPENGTIIVLRHSINFIRQEFHCLSSQRTFARNYTGSDWTEWHEYASSTLTEESYLRKDGPQELGGDLDAKDNYTITNLRAAEAGSSEPVRQYEHEGDIDLVKSAINDHISSSDDHAAYYLKNTSEFKGDLNTITDPGVTTVVEDANNLNLPGSSVDGTLLTQSTFAIDQVDITIGEFKLSQFFISTREDKIWIRKGRWGASEQTLLDEGGNPIPGPDGDLKGYLPDEAPPVWDPWVAILTESHGSSHDHDSEYLANRTYSGNLNSLSVIGVLDVASASTNKPAGAVKGIVISSKNSETSETWSQVFVDTTTNRTWSRIKNAASVWSDWEAIWTSSQVEKDMSNPGYIKYPGGLLEQFGTVDVSHDFASPLPVSFSIPFHSVSQVMVTSTDANYSYTSGNVLPSSFSVSAGLRHDTGGTADAVRIQWRAIGTHSA